MGVCVSVSLLVRCDHPSFTDKRRQKIKLSARSQLKRSARSAPSACSALLGHPPRVRATRLCQPRYRMDPAALWRSEGQRLDEARNPPWGRALSVVAVRGFLDLNDIKALLAGSVLTVHSRLGRDLLKARHFYKWCTALP